VAGLFGDHGQEHEAQVAGFKDPLAPAAAAFASSAVVITAEAAAAERVAAEMSLMAPLMMMSEHD
jgi:hypothetical protein